MHCDFSLCMHQFLWLVESEKLLLLQFAALDSLNLQRIELFNSVYYQFLNSISASDAAIQIPKQLHLTLSGVTSAKHLL